MRKRICTGLLALTAGLAAVAYGPGPVAAQPKSDKATPPKYLYGQDLKVRKGGDKFFDANTPRIGVEVWENEATKAAVAISEAGALAVFPAGPVGSEKGCKWLTAHDLLVRKAGETDFTQKTKKWGVELFLAQGSNRLLYACESGSIAFAPAPATLVTDKGPKWHHALEPKVRTPEEERFDTARKFGVEVFTDENTGGLIYATETGAIATAPPAKPLEDPKKVAPPKPAYGLVLHARKFNEPDFSDKTKRYGVEVFEDPNANTLFYLSETGSVAVVPNPGKFNDSAKGVPPKWVTAMNLGVRKAGEKDFTDKTRRYGVEVFQDNRTGNLVFISETGAIAVLPK